MHTHLKQQRKERRCLSVSHSFLPPFLSSFPLWLTPSESIDSRREGRQGCRWRSVLQQQQQHCSKAMREEGTRQGNETLQMKSERGAFPLSKHSSSLFPSPISLMEDLSYSYMEILIYPRSPSSSLLNVSSRLFSLLLLAASTCALDFSRLACSACWLSSGCCCCRRRRKAVLLFAHCHVNAKCALLQPQECVEKRNMKHAGGSNSENDKHPGSAEKNILPITDKRIPLQH